MAHHSELSARWEQLTRLNVPHIRLLNEPTFLETQSREGLGTAELQAEPEVTFHGEFLDTFDNLSIAFELEDARQSSVETVGAKSVHENLYQEEDMGTAAAPNYHHHEQLVIHQTCASAYTQLLQRRCASLREVLTAVAASRQMDGVDKSEDQIMAVEEEQGAGAGDVVEHVRSLTAPYPLVQQLLCPFIQLAASTHGEVSVQALRTVGQILAAQQPLMLVNERTTWLPQLLDWLQRFLMPAEDERGNLFSTQSDVRGVAAGAMLDLGMCSGSLRCILLTVVSLLAHASPNASSIDFKYVQASVERLRVSTTISTSSPCGGSTVFMPVAHLEALRPRHKSPLASTLGASQRDFPALSIPRVSTAVHDFTASLKSSKFISVACDGEYLYVHSPAGLTKYGTGYMSTTMGHIYAHKARYLNQRPWLACVGGRLYLRSPAMAPDCLVVVDSASLEEVGRVNPSAPAQSLPLNKDGSASAMFPEKVSKPGDVAGRSTGGGGGGSGPGGRPDRPWTTGTRPGGVMDALGLAGSEMEIETSEGDEPLHDLIERPLNASRDFLQQYRETMMRGRASLSSSDRQRASALLSSPLELAAPARAAGSASRTAAPPQPTPGPLLSGRSSQSIESHSGVDPDVHARTDLASGSSPVQRSPVISDGRYLHIIAKSDKTRQTPPPPSRLHLQDVRDEDDESSEGGGQIGSSWDNFNFTIDTFDAEDGMRHVRNVCIQGPACDYGLHEGEGILSCCACGLVMTSTTLGHHCQECNPDYDLCNQCWMRGATSLGHKSHHQCRPMDLRGPHDAQPTGGEHLHLPAFPAKCLDYQSFYTDGNVLMVLIPPELCQGCKIPGFLCRVFDIVQGNHLYDISLGDFQEDPRKDLGKLSSGASCYDPVNDLVWSVDVDGFKVRRWRHPWTSPLDIQVSVDIDEAHMSSQPKLALSREEAVEIFQQIDVNGKGEISQIEFTKALQKDSALAKRLGVPTEMRQEDESRKLFALKYAGADQDQSKAISLGEFLAYYHGDSCLKRQLTKLLLPTEDGAAIKSPIQEGLRAILRCLYNSAEKHARCVMEPCYEAQQSWVPFCIEARQSTFTSISSILDACVKHDKIWAGAGKSQGIEGPTTTGADALENRSLNLELVRTCMRLIVVNIGHFAAAQEEEKSPEIIQSLAKLKANIMLIAESYHDAQTQSDNNFKCAVEEATNALTAGLDTFFPTADEQAILLIQLLKNVESKKDQPHHVLAVLAAHLSKPAACNLIFSIFDGRWLAERQTRGTLAQELLVLVLERARASTQVHSPEQTLDGREMETDGAEHYLLNLAAAFQRHLLSIPLSARRSNAESEALMLFFARHLFDHAQATFQDLIKNDGVHDLAAPFIRVLVLPLATAFTDNSWSQNLTTNLATDMLPRLMPLMKMLDQLNSKVERLRLQDEVFSTKGTETRFIGGRIVSIARCKASKVTTKVQIPGAAHMLIRISEDVALTKKEQLKVTWESREIQGGRENKSELVIKGSQRGKRVWRSFRCPGDTISLHYTRTVTGAANISEALDFKGFRNIRFAVYGCAPNSALQMNLHWLLGLELTLASLTAKFMWSSLRQSPAPASSECLPWVSTFPLFSGGFDHAWLEVHCPQIALSAIQSPQSTEPTSSDMDQQMSLPAPWCNEAFTLFVADYFQRHIRTPDWLRHSFFCSTAQSLVAGIIKATGLTRLADDFGCKWTTEADIPEHLQYVLGSSTRIIQGLVMDMRKKLQKSVTLQSSHSSQDVSSTYYSMEVDEGGDAGGTSNVETESESIDTVKRLMSRLANEKARQMILRCSLLMATIFENEEGLGCCVAASKLLRYGLPTSTSTSMGGGGAKNGGDVVSCGIDLASRFLSADVPASDLLSLAAQSSKVIEERKHMLQSMTTLLQTISLSSVRQVLISTFVTGPSPAESHRTLIRFSPFNNLHICRKESIQSLRGQVANFFTYLATSLESWVDTKPVDMSKIAVTHLILNCTHLLQLHAGDAEWLLSAGIVDKLCNIMVDTKNGHLMGASPEQLMDTIECDSLSGVRDAAFGVLSALTTTLAGLAAERTDLRFENGILVCNSEEGTHIGALLDRAIEVAAHLVNGANLHPSCETRDVFQLKTLMWLYDLVSKHHVMANLIVRNEAVRQALMKWSLDADSPQVQRVTLRVLTRVLCSDKLSVSGHSSLECLLKVSSRGEHIVQSLLASIGAVLGAEGGLQSSSKEPDNLQPDVSMQSETLDMSTIDLFEKQRDRWSASDPEAKSSKEQQWMVMVWPSSPETKRGGSDAPKVVLSREEAVEIFNQIDVNCNGEISQIEFIKALQKDSALAKRLGFPNEMRQEDESRKLFALKYAGADQDQSKAISLGEFLQHFQMDDTVRSEVESVCKLALQQVGRYQDTCAAVSTSVAAEKAKQVASAIASGERACAYVGAYQDCQTISWQWESMHSIALVFKTGQARDSTKDTHRWRSGHVKYSVAQHHISLLQALYRSSAASASVADELVSALSVAATQWEKLASNPALQLTREVEVDIQKGIAVLETICGKLDVFMRVGSHVKLRETGSSARNTCRSGVIVRCDHLMGLMSVLPHTVLASRSLQSVVPTTVPMGGALVTVNSTHGKPFLLTKQDATTVMRCLVNLFSQFQTVLNLQSSGVSLLSRWCRVMQSRAFCTLAHILQNELVEVHQVVGSGMLSALVEHAIENPSCHDLEMLELRRANITAALCESSDKSPASLLAAARTSGSNGGGGGPGSGGASDAPAGGVGGSAGSTARAASQRIVPSVESLFRTSRAKQRQDQRRTRELAAAELAEISRQPIRLCQHALERENGNQDRAANWLFEQGEAFLAEHPDFAEVPDGANEGGSGGASSAEDTEVPLFLLYDAFSYYEDMQASALGGESEHVLGSVAALGAAIVDLPTGMLDDLRANGHIPSDDHGIRAYDERMLGGQPNLIFGRARASMQVAGVSQRRDDSVRAGHFVILTEMDVLGDACYSHGKKGVGKTFFVESVERTPLGQQAKLTMYDTATASVRSIVVPLVVKKEEGREIIKNVEKVTQYDFSTDCDLLSDDTKTKASVEVDGKLTSVYARSCLRWMLQAWPESEAFDESSLGGRHRVIRLAQAAALGACCSASDIPNPVPGVPKLAVDAGGSFSTVLLLRLSGLLARQIPVDEHYEEQDDTGMQQEHDASITSSLSKHKREREATLAEAAGTAAAGDSEEAGSARDKRRRFGLDTSDEISFSAAAQQHSQESLTREFHKPPPLHQPATPLLQFLVDECLQSLKAAVECQNVVEQASEHPYVHTASNTTPNSRRCLHVEGAWALLVVFDSRCALPAGETLRFFNDAVCTEIIATAAMDDRRKGFLPLVLPSPVWMQVGTTVLNASDDGENNWGFRVQAFPLGEASMALALWLAELLAPLRHKSTAAILEALLDILDKSVQTVAPPHCMQAHRLAMNYMQRLAVGEESSKLLCQHQCFAKLVHEATARQQWESKVPATAARQAGETARCPHSTYLCSVAELLATRSLTIRRVSCHPDASSSASLAPMPAWLKALDKTMGIVASLNSCNQSQLESFIDEACAQFNFESSVSADGMDEDVSRMLEGGQLSGAAKEALSELFHVEPDAAAQVARHLCPPQAPAHNKRDFLQHAQTLLLQDQTKMSELMGSFGLDRFLVRWGPDRDTDLVILVNMLTETEQGLISPLDSSIVGKMELTEYHQRKLPRLGFVPQLALQRRLMLLKLLNHNLDKCLVTLDFSRRTHPSSLAASVCELQHLVFHQIKASLHNAVIEWTTCSQARPGASAGSQLSREVLVHRPGRRARDNKEKAEDHERWRLHISLPSSASSTSDKLEEFLVAPSDFGSAREMPADATVTARLVLADPPNGALPLRNAQEVRGNIALIERGGGQFVNVVRRAQEAGAIGVIVADSKEGPLFLMSTELGNSGDDVNIPAVLLSLADSMLLLMRQHAVTATISADGVLMQTYRQLRYAPAAHLRQRDEMAWRVKFQGEGHQGYQGPYREAMSALCSELQSPQLQLFVPCANALGSVGDNRDKFVPRPSASSDEMLDTFYFVGQLMGVAVRTRNLLNLDLPSLVWKSLVGIELDDEDLKATDFSCWNALQFRDHDGQGITASTFEALLHQCRFTCCLTDGSEVPLLPGGHLIPVTFSRRTEYARLVIKARLNESERQLSKMRSGLCSVIPEQLLGFMTWEELERRVCGSPEVDLASLKRHTQYRQGVDKDSPHIKMFWEVLEAFSQADRRLFLRFAWGRERLPLESEYTTDHDMKVFPSDRGDGDKVLPESETCFFIIKLPRYRTKELMRDNLYAAITACREINY